MRNKNLLVVGSALALALILFGVSRLTDTRETPVPGPSAPSLTANAETPAPVDAATPMVTATPTATASSTATTIPTATAAAGTTTAPDSSAEQAKAYLVVTVNNMMYQPIPLIRETSYTLTQKDIGAVNVVHVTADSVWMESSTCEGHDCVKQGTVSLENRGQRVLGNMIICLPNKVSLELYTPEEAQDLLSTSGADAP